MKEAHANVGEKSEIEFQNLQSKTKEIDALNEDIETQTASVGEIAAHTTEKENDLNDPKEVCATSQQFFTDVAINCENKQKESAKYHAIQTQVLNDGDVLELFKKALPIKTCNFLQEAQHHAAVATPAAPRISVWTF